MTLSIFTTIKDPEARMDPWREAIESYAGVADEVVVVNGGKPVSINNPKVKIIDYPWPEEFEWKFIGEQFTRGYYACRGDWVMRCDIDYILHEDDYWHIRKKLRDNMHAPAMTTFKYKFLKADRFNLKYRPLLLVNKEFCSNRITYSGGNDMCDPQIDKKNINGIIELRDGVYNYDFTFKTEEVVANDFWRFAKAKFKLDGSNWGYESPEHALKFFKKMMKGSFKHKNWRKIKLEDHPKFIQDRIKNLKPEQFGFNLWGMV